jgi:hypothetical protein
MAKFLYSAAMSLDGFIAGPGGDVSWMADHLGPNPVVDQLIAQTGAILVGQEFSREIFVGSGISAGKAAFCCALHVLHTDGFQAWRRRFFEYRHGRRRGV